VVSCCCLQAAGTGTVLKDLDLQQRFRLEPGYTKGLYEQLDADTRLLSAAGMMGYSMLLGVHERQQADQSTAISTDPHAEPVKQQQQHNVAEHSNAAGKVCLMLGLVGICHFWAEAGC